MEYTNKSQKYYDNCRLEMQDLLPKNAKKVLDVGCGKGAMAFGLKEKYDVEVWGVEFMEEEAKIAKTRLDHVVESTIENSIHKLPDDYFDVIYFNDVLEHLVNPNKVLEIIKTKLCQEGVVISSIPNVRYHKVFQQYIFKKDWQYERAGVMDFTHLRFFTSKSIKNMYEKAGFKIIEHKGITKTKSIMPYFYNVLLLFTASDMFYAQFATIVKKT